MTINLTTDLQAYIEAKIASGQYASPDEVVEALLELRNLDTGELNARWLNAKIAVGVASLDIDGGLTMDQVKERMQKYREHHLARVKR